MKRDIHDLTCVGDTCYASNCAFHAVQQLPETSGVLVTERISNEMGMLATAAREKPEVTVEVVR